MAKKQTTTAKIRAFILENPKATSGYIAEKFNVKSTYVSTIKWKLKQTPAKNVQKFMGVTMATGDIPKLTDEQVTRLADNAKKPKLRMMTSSGSKPLIMEYTPPKKPYVAFSDPVNHPSHYTHGGIETIDYIEAKGLGYHLGNAVKYISRAGRKGTNQGLEDLKKAQWYLARAIEKNEHDSPNR